MDIQELLRQTSARHTRLCPRQVLGVRIGLAGLAAHGWAGPPDRGRLLVIVETDGCFTDGVEAATGCTVGRRTLRVQDFGKVAAVFVDTITERTVRIAPRGDARARAEACAPSEPNPYYAQLQAYQVMPDADLLTVCEVRLQVPVATIVARPGERVSCDNCGEEIINQREVLVDGRTRCRTCAGQAYYGIP